MVVCFEISKDLGKVRRQFQSLEGIELNALVNTFCRFVSNFTVKGCLKIPSFDQMIFFFLGGGLRLKAVLLNLWVAAQFWVAKFIL